MLCASYVRRIVRRCPLWYVCRRRRDFRYRQNEERRSHDDIDRAQFYDKRIESTGKSAAEIARELGVDKSVMTYYKAFSTLPEEVMTVIKRDRKKFTAQAAYQVSKILARQGLRKALWAAENFLSDGKSVRWLMELAGAVPSTKIRTNEIASTSYVQKFANGFFRNRGLLFEVSMKVSPEQHEAFTKALQAAIDTVAIAKQPPEEKE